MWPQLYKKAYGLYPNLLSNHMRALFLPLLMLDFLTCHDNSKLQHDAATFLNEMLPPAILKTIWDVPEPLSNHARALSATAYARLNLQRQQ